ncbi:MAG: phosphoglycerate dehydrogenase [Lachnospiraceae bacterium]|nr:phosphoglycerate dehydrogenase [Lachnospiraceae bacterium]
MELKKIGWLQVHAPELCKEEDENVPEGFTTIRPTDETDPTEIRRIMEEADYLITADMTRDDFAIAKNLKMIQKWGIGVDRIDLDAAAENNIPVYITSGANSIPVAELAVGLMLSAFRRIPYVDKTVREGKWIRKNMRAECQMLNGKTIGLLGIGNIAKKVARMVSGFDPKEIIYYDIRPLTPEQEEALGAHYVSFEELCRRADVLSVHVPLMPATKGMIGEEQFNTMKPNMILVNTARGGVVNEKALIKALKEGKIYGAALDTFESEPIEKDNPLLTMDNVVLTCHCGGGVVDNVMNVTRHAYYNIAAFEKGEAPKHPQDVIVAKK